ncbi:ATP-grasp_3 domain-containing protein [Azospirillaceae bacterium]
MSPPIAPPKIALFANKDSNQVAEVAAAVSAEGAVPVVLDIRVGGQAAQSDQPAVTLTDNGARWADVDFDQIHAIHIRCTAPRTLPTLPPVINAASHAEYRAQFIKEQAFQATTYAFFEHLAARGKLVANRLIHGYIEHNSKGQFYEKLRAAGFHAPRSLNTNCPEHAARFLDEVGEAVLKPTIGIGSTRVVSEDDRKRLDELIHCPTLFQERLHGNTIRVHVVGDSMVLALRIIADDIDSRTDAKDFEPITLPEAECEAIARANRFLGLHYAAWDAIMTPDGRLCYLDCNPGPFLLWLPLEARTQVFRHLARYLIRFSESGSLEEASAIVCRSLASA